MSILRKAGACVVAGAMVTASTLPLWAQARAAGVGTVAEVDASRSEMKPLIERYVSDRGAVGRTYPVATSPTRAGRYRQLYTEWRERLGKLDFAAMSLDGRVDYVLFANHLDYELRQLDIQAKQLAEMGPLLPFAKMVVDLEESRRRFEPVKPAEVAATLNRLKKLIEDTQARVEAGLPRQGAGRGGAPAGGGGQPQEAGPESIRVKKTVAFRAVAAVTALRAALRNWFGFYNGYDPVFTWWAEEPYRGLDQTLNTYIAFLSERVAGVRLDEGAGGAPGVGPGRGGAGGGGGAPGGQRPAGAGQARAAARPGDASDIIGDPLGREALLVDLANEMIPYTPEELVALANKEMIWCEGEMLKASRELGYGEDWRKALEHVKSLYVEPGKQTQVIRDLANEAIEYMEKNDLLTIDPLAKETWRMEMMSPERQLQNPFFLGGEQITVSYPTNTMSHEAKMMSMRGNNPHFSRATVHHELIPGHHMQQFMTARFKDYRGLFSTPFWGEGWSLYWELLLWDMGFAKKPEDRIGMLFWRMHRCARIMFSLSFHLGTMNPQECIDLLIKRVGHEPENAVAEVRRSFAGNYSPLYQAAYLLGGLQFRALQKELVGGGKMTHRQFHDAILRENRIPVEMVRAILTKQAPPRDFKTSWKFYGAVATASGN
jgi:hypothetical protein